MKYRILLGVVVSLLSFAIAKADLVLDVEGFVETPPTLTITDQCVDTENESSISYRHLFNATRFKEGSDPVSNASDELHLITDSSIGSPINLDTLADWAKTTNEVLKDDDNRIDLQGVPLNMSQEILAEYDNDSSDVNFPSGDPDIDDFDKGINCDLLIVSPDKKNDSLLYAGYDSDVPEPTGIALLGLVGLVLMLRRYRK